MLKPKPITIEGRGRGGGGFLIGSSLPNHDAKGRKENQGQTASERVRAQKSQQITIYMMHEVNAHMMHALMH